MAFCVPIASMVTIAPSFTLIAGPPSRPSESISQISALTICDSALVSFGFSLLLQSQNMRSYKAAAKPCHRPRTSGQSRRNLERDRGWETRRADAEEVERQGGCAYRSLGASADRDAVRSYTLHSCQGAGSCGWYRP